MRDQVLTIETGIIAEQNGASPRGTNQLCVAKHRYIVTGRKQNKLLLMENSANPR